MKNEWIVNRTDAIILPVIEDSCDMLIIEELKKDIFDYELEIKGSNKYFGYQHMYFTKEMCQCMFNYLKENYK